MTEIVSTIGLRFIASSYAVGSRVEIEINDDRYDNEGQPSGCRQ